MFKRIKYVSRYSKPLSEGQLELLGERAAAKNRELGITGLLMASGGLFYQVLEGPPSAVDDVFSAIATDDRHTDLIVLSVQEGVERRLFPDWSMKTVDLDAAAHVRLLPLKVLIKAVFEQRMLIDNMLWAIERTLKHELSGTE
jgi:hypothetical protein